MAAWQCFELLPYTDWPRKNKDISPLTEFVQDAKDIFIGLLGISRDAAHVHIGLLIFFVSVILWRKGRIDEQSLFPVLAIALLGEIIDIIDYLVTQGDVYWSNSLEDIVQSMLWPVLIVAMAKARKILT